MIVRKSFTYILALYIRYCFYRARRSGGTATRNVYFKRGSFTNDVEAMRNANDVVVNGNVLRRILMLIVEPYQLEQIVCIYYAESLRRCLSELINSFCKECKRSGVRCVYFGGIDYFEVVIFQQRIQSAGIESVAIFHENYTIPLVEQQTKNLLSSYPEVPNFTRVYAIGPLALGILKRLFSDVRPHGLPRFQYSNTCHEFKHDVLLIPFSDIAYFAPTAFALTYSFLLDLAKRMPINVVVKHKNRVEQRRFIRSFGASTKLRHTLTPSASTLCEVSRVVVCFNSLVYFEALSRGHMIALPAFAEARLGEIYSQHRLRLNAEDTGVWTFSSPEELEILLCKARELIPVDRLRWAESRRALIAEYFYSDMTVVQ